MVDKSTDKRRSVVLVVVEVSGTERGTIEGTIDNL